MARKIKARKKKESRRRPQKAKKSAGSTGKNKFSKKDLVEFKKFIARKKDELLEDIQHISDDTLKKSQKEASGDISGYTYHMADVASDTYDREFSLGLASSERQILYELEDALKKMDEGRYGVCEICSQLISKNRLKAVPHARLCVKCQERKEKR